MADIPRSRLPTPARLEDHSRRLTDNEVLAARGARAHDTLQRIEAVAVASLWWVRISCICVIVGTLISVALAVYYVLR